MGRALRGAAFTATVINSAPLKRGGKTGSAQWQSLASCSA